MISKMSDAFIGNFMCLTFLEMFGCMQGVLVSLAREVQLLSASLKKAGWSVPDVTETMKMGLSAFF